MSKQVIGEREQALRKQREKLADEMAAEAAALRKTKASKPRPAASGSKPKEKNIEQPEHNQGAAKAARARRQARRKQPKGRRAIDSALR